MFFLKHSLLRSLLLSAISAGLLVLAFPGTDFWPLAWVGLVPLLKNIEGQKPLTAFVRAYLCGLMFFGGTLYWLIHVTLPGMLLLVLYLSVYFGLFGVGYNVLARSAKARQEPEGSWRPFAVAGLWTLLEFIRAHFLTGFGWVSLGHSQSKNLVLIQIADIAGVYGVSFLIVMVNYFLKELWQTFRARQHFPKIPANLSWYLPIPVLAIALSYGVLQLTLRPTGTPGVAGGSQAVIAVVQGNIAQEMKWYKPAWSDIMARYQMLTEAAAQESPDLIIWPETSFPGLLWEDKDTFDELKSFVARVGIPLLLGSIVQENGYYYNTAILLSPGGEVVQQYKKIHLVPFGEYLPLRFLFPFLAHIVPIDDFTAGKDYTVFEFPSGKKALRGRNFSVLVCFEDTLETLTRQFVRNGAELLVNITNDAWFKDTNEPFMHAQTAVFRTVENRRALVRAANTGVSGFIDASGRMFKVLQDENGKKTYVPGYALAKVPFHQEKTFYTRYGDVFILVCIGCLSGAFCFRNKRKQI